MQILRTIFWVLLTMVLVAFIAINWNPVRVNIWPLASGYLYFDWPVGFIVLASFLIGLVPMWLLSRAARWRLTRRITTLENSVRANSTQPAPPLATTTQLEAANPDAARL